jgi:SOS-response transcriptional repressor LexA
VLVVHRTDKGWRVGRFEDWEVAAKYVDMGGDQVVLRTSNPVYPDVRTDQVEVEGRVVRHVPRSRVM